MTDAWPAALAEFVVDGPVGLVSIDARATIVHANRTAREILGCDVTGLNIMDLIHPDDRDRILAATMIRTWTVKRSRGTVWRMLLPGGQSVEILTQTATITVDGVPYVQLAFLAAPPRLAVLQTLQSVAAAQPLAETFASLMDGISSDENAVAINWIDPDGTVRLFGNLPPALAGVDAAGHRDVDPATPWYRAASAGTAARLESLDGLPPEVADAAKAAGFVACCVSPVPDPATGEALLYVNWVRYESHLSYVLQTFADVLHDVLQVALQRAEDARRLEYAAHHDQLTGLANRRAFFDALTQALVAGPVSVLYLDLDGFKPVNDRLGHDAGDRVLAEVADRLGECTPAHGLAARLGGDEFSIVLPGDDGALAEALADRVVNEVRRPVVLDGPLDVTIGVSIGFSVTDGSTPRDPTQVMLAADEALRSAKGEGKGTWVRA